MMPPRPPLTIVKLSDHFGQYVLTLTCECGHAQAARPERFFAHDHGAFRQLDASGRTGYGSGFGRRPRLSQAVDDNALSGLTVFTLSHSTDV